MKKLKLFLLVALIFLVPSLAYSQRDTRIEQEHYRDFDERNDWKDYVPGGKDWAVLFTYPENARNVQVIAYGNKERAVLRASTINYSWNEAGRRYVKVLTGSGARKNAEYGGSRNEWARSLRLVYTAPFKPRRER